MAGRLGMRMDSTRQHDMVDEKSSGMQPVDCINPLACELWDEIVGRFPHSTVFHTRAWAQLLHDSYGYFPLYGIRRVGKDIAAVLPMMEVKSRLTGKRGVSLPFTDYCDPLVSSPGDEANLFIQYQNMAVSRSWKYIEYRTGPGALLEHAPAAPFCLHTIDLGSGDLDHIYRQFKLRTRRNISKSDSPDLTLSVSDTREALEGFIRLHTITRKHHGVPPQPRYFFENLYRLFIGTGRGIIVQAHHKARVVAANVYLHDGNKAVYKYGASDRQYLHLNASYSVMWRAIQWYTDRGAQELSLGRTHVENEGLMQFKNGWGAKLSPISYFLYIPKERRYIAHSVSHRKVYQGVVRLTPVPILRMAGTLLYPHIG